MSFKLTKLADKTCETCPLYLHPSVNKQVPTEVHPNDHDGSVDVMFVAEAPGETEDSVGRPVVGVSGKILRRVIVQLNGSEKGTAYGNVVRCRPTTEDGNNRKPTPKEIGICCPNILDTIRKINPKRIVICGKSAAQGLALDPDTREPINPNISISKLRGLDYIVRTPDGSEYPATITYHFAYVARNPVSGSIFREDILRSFMRAKNEVPDYSKPGRPAVIADTVDKVRKLLEHMVHGLTSDTIVAMDYETDSISRINNKVLTVGFAFEPDRAFVIPYEHVESPWTSRELQEVRALLTKFFQTRKASYRSIVPHNAKFEAAITADAFGAYLGNLKLEDTMLRAHALNENRKAALGAAFGLKTLADEWLGFKGYEEPYIAEVVGLRNNGDLASASLRPLCDYNGMDCYVTYRLFHFGEAIARREGYQERLKRLGLGIHGPESAFASAMERNGIRVDMDRLEYYMTQDSPIYRRQKELEEELYGKETVKIANKMLLGSRRRVAGMQSIWGDQKDDPWVFSINKAESKKALYLDVLGLEANTTKSGKPSVDKDFYKRNKGIREVDILSEWTALDKLRGTYIEGIYKLVRNSRDMQDGRVRAAFNFHTTATSRTSSDSPNMQNIPKGKTPTAKAIKSLYITDEGYVMVCVDYSQAEVRWLAEMSGDDNLITAFQNVAKAKDAYLKNPTPENEVRLLSEGDFHRQTAAQLNDKDPQYVTDLERGAAKSVVFGLVYGMSAFGLASRLGIEVSEAEAYQEKFLNQFPQAKEWLSMVERQGFKEGYVESPIGRRRHLLSGFLVGSDNQFVEFGDGTRVPTDICKFKSYEDRVCRNAPIQSIASDTNLMACIAIQNYIIKNRRDWRLINIVHDSIIAEIPFPEVEEYTRIVNQIMIDPNLFKTFGFKLRVPFKVDFTVGPNWGDQLDVEIMERYFVHCNSCEEERLEKAKPENRRCEECGSKDAAVGMTQGPLKKLLKYLDSKYLYSEYWKYRNGKERNEIEVRF